MKGGADVLKIVCKKVIAVLMCFSILFTVLSIPASAEIPFPCMAEIANTRNGTTDIYSLPGTTGHEADAENKNKSQKLDTLKEGTVIQITGAGIDGDGDKWYEINYGDGFKKTGFVYSARIKVTIEYTEDPEFEAWLTEQDFPESYKVGLRNLHAIYPKWKFYADHTNLDFNAAVKAQNGGVNNKYIHKDSDISWKVYEKGEYDWSTGKWTGYDGDSWIKTTDQVVAYYLDPRNFLDTKNVFMFANESFNAEKEDLNFVKNAVKGTFMDAVLPEYAVKTEQITIAEESSEVTGENTGEGENTEEPVTPPKPEPKTYADAILEAAQKSGVSTATIVAVIRQEQGTKGTGSLISGTYSSTKYPTELKGYYNFFNIGAYADAKNGYPSAADRGLWWAKGMKNGATTYGRPWNTREKAIIGGALWYGGNYVSVGQNTIYYKNFNVYKNTEYETHKHQYATNIEDSVGKGSIMAGAMDFLADGEIIFHIPVYKNMPEKTTLPKKGTNNNRFLKSLSVEGYTLSTTCDRYKYAYELIVPHTAANVKINAVSEADDAKISGAGEVSLAYGNNDIKVVVTSSGGATATYNLTIYREKAPSGEAEMPTVNTAYKIDKDNVISGITDNTSVSDFKTKLSVTKGKAVIMDSLGNEKKDGLIATGDKVHLYDTNDKIRATYTVLIYGDINGDGKITSKDVYYSRRLILEVEELPAINIKASDVNKDFKVSTKDVYYIRRHILELEIITQ